MRRREVSHNHHRRRLEPVGDAVHLLTSKVDTIRHSQPSDGLEPVEDPAGQSRQLIEV